MRKGIENVRYDRSQTPPTRLGPLGTSFKKALRLKRDQFCLRELDNIPMSPWERIGNQLQHP